MLCESTRHYSQTKLLLPMLARMTGWNASGLNTEQAHLLTHPSQGVKRDLNLSALADNDFI